MSAAALAIPRILRFTCTELLKRTERAVNLPQPKCGKPGSEPPISFVTMFSQVEKVPPSTGPITALRQMLASSNAPLSRECQSRAARSVRTSASRARLRTVVLTFEPSRLNLHEEAGHCRNSQCTPVAKNLDFFHIFNATPNGAELLRLHAERSAPTQLG